MNEEDSQQQFQESLNLDVNESEIQKLNPKKGVRIEENKNDIFNLEEEENKYQNDQNNDSAEYEYLNDAQMRQVKTFDKTYWEKYPLYLAEIMKSFYTCKKELLNPNISILDHLKQGEIINHKQNQITLVEHEDLLELLNDIQISFMCVTQSVTDNSPDQQQEPTQRVQSHKRNNGKQEKEKKHFFDINEGQGKKSFRARGSSYSTLKVSLNQLLWSLVKEYLREASRETEEEKENVLEIIQAYFQTAQILTTKYNKNYLDIVHGDLIAESEKLFDYDKIIRDFYKIGPKSHAYFRYSLKIQRKSLIKMYDTERIEELIDTNLKKYQNFKVNICIQLLKLMKQLQIDNDVVSGSLTYNVLTIFQESFLPHLRKIDSKAYPDDFISEKKVKLLPDFIYSAFNFYNQIQITDINNENRMIDFKNEALNQIQKNQEIDDINKKHTNVLDLQKTINKEWKKILENFHFSLSFSSSLSQGQINSGIEMENQMEISIMEAEEEQNLAINISLQDALNQTKIKNMQFILEKDANRQNNEERQQFFQDTMTLTIGTCASIAEIFINKYKECIEDSRKRDQLFITARYMHKIAHQFTLRVIRLLRASNVNEIMYENFTWLIEFLTKSKFQTTKQQGELKNSLNIAKSSLDKKYQILIKFKSEKFQEFQESFPKFKDFIDNVIKEITDQQKKQKAEDIQVWGDHDQIKQMYDYCMKNMNDRDKTIRNTFQSTYDMFHLALSEDDKYCFKEEITAIIKYILQLKETEKLNVDFIGLTEAGLQFNQSALKIIVRVKDYQAQYKKVTEQLSKNDYKPYQMLKARPGQNVIYLERKGDDKNYPKDVTFKLRFEHPNRIHQIKLAQLMKNYVNFDTQRILRLAFFFIFILKANKVVGNDEFPNSLSYLIVLFNYLQSISVLPNLQHKRDEYEKLENTEYVQDERVQTAVDNPNPLEEYERETQQRQQRFIQQQPRNNKNTQAQVLNIIHKEKLTQAMIDNFKKWKTPQRGFLNAENLVGINQSNIQRNQLDEEIKSTVTTSQMDIFTEELSAKEQKAISQLEGGCYLQINYWYAEKSLQREMIAKLSQEESNLSNNRPNKSSKLFIKFIKYLCIKLPQRNKEFSLRKGQPKHKRLVGSLVSIKDPFLKFINYGFILNILRYPDDKKEENSRKQYKESHKNDKFQKINRVFLELLESISDNRLNEFILGSFRSSLPKIQRKEK